MSTVLRACQDLPIQAFAAGEVLVAEGSPPGVLYVLASGSVEVVKGDVQITTVAEPGAFFGEMSVLLATRTRRPCARSSRRPSTSSRIRSASCSAHPESRSSWRGCSHAGCTS